MLFSVDSTAIVSSQNLVTNSIYSDMYHSTCNVVHSHILIITCMHLTIIIDWFKVTLSYTMLCNIQWYIVSHTKLVISFPL